MSFLLYFNTLRFPSINKEISLSSRSLLVSRISFSLKTSKFGKHSLFSSGETSVSFHLVSQKPDVAFVENLSNRSSGVQIPWDICTLFGCYLYSTECSRIIILNISRFPKHGDNNALLGVCSRLSWGM